MTGGLIYKICDEPSWREAVAEGLYYGSVHDVRDGFIHFSTAEQLSGTAAKHFAGQTGLLLIAVAAARLGPSLKWEPSRGGALFPHLYGYLPVSAATRVWPLPLSEEGADKGTHVFPEGVLPAGKSVSEVGDV